MPDITQIAVTNIKSATHGTSAIKGVDSVMINVNEEVYEGRHDGDPGITSQVSVGLDVSGTLNASSLAVLTSLIGVADANLVLVGKVSGGGGDKTVTLKNVKFRGTGYNMQKVGTQAPSSAAVQFKCTMGTSDTLATMVTVT